MGREVGGGSEGRRHVYLWPVRDDGENHHNIVNNYPSITKKSANRRSSVTPDFTPTPVPTGSLSCFRGNGQVVESLYGLSPGPPRGPRKGDQPPAHPSLLFSRACGLDTVAWPAGYCPGCCPFVPRASAPGDLESACLEASPPSHCAGRFLPLSLPLCSPEGPGCSRGHQWATPALYPFLL